MIKVVMATQHCIDVTHLLRQGDVVWLPHVCQGNDDIGSGTLM
jgi:hypothetical protein